MGSMYLSTLLLFTLLMVSASKDEEKTHLNAHLPYWNWEEVILSRNGPSTSTTPRPLRFTTTTLRSMGPPTWLGEGQGSVEETVLVRTTSRPKPIFSYPLTSSSNKNSNLIVATLMSSVGILALFVI